MIGTGRVWKLGDHVDTDAILPARHLTTADPKVLARHCLEDALPHFAAEVAAGDVLVAGENFGCGSSREHAPIALQAAGVFCVVAASFARIFYRNAINIGLAVLVCPAAARRAETCHTLEVDLASGTVTNRTLGERYVSEPYPPFLVELIAAGGLVPFTRQRLGSAGFSGRRAAPNSPGRTDP